jgi:hypothetical protein
MRVAAILGETKKMSSIGGSENNKETKEQSGANDQFLFAWKSQRRRRGIFVAANAE